MGEEADILVPLGQRSRPSLSGLALGEFASTMALEDQEAKLRLVGNILRRRILGLDRPSAEPLDSPRRGRVLGFGAEEDNPNLLLQQ